LEKQIKNKKLVILISSLVQRGAERRASDLANQLSQKGYNVDLIALGKRLDFNISEKVSYFRVSSLKARANKFRMMGQTPIFVNMKTKPLIF
jgi:cytolysin (calcineurin-like family phosphatase)